VSELKAKDRAETDMVNRMRVAALLPFGDRAVSKDWEIMKLPQIQIRPKKKA